MPHSPDAPIDLVKMIEEICLPESVVMGPLKEGVYIQVAMGRGFYVPEEAFNRVKQLANETGKIQFLTLTQAGEPLHGTREECQHLGNGSIAWIVPQRR